MGDEAATYLVFGTRLIVAGLFGAIVGWEREAREKAAGLRTHVLVCLGACLFTLISLRMNDDFRGVDIMRLVQGLLLAIGFMAGGVIFMRGGSVTGLTTAAGLWVLTAVGLAVGLGYYFLGAAGTLLAFLTMSGLKRVDMWLHSKTEAERIVGDLAARAAARAKPAPDDAEPKQRKPDEP